MGKILLTKSGKPLENVLKDLKEAKKAFIYLKTMKDYFDDDYLPYQEGALQACKDIEKKIKERSEELFLLKEDDEKTHQYCLVQRFLGKLLNETQKNKRKRQKYVKTISSYIQGYEYGLSECLYI